MAAGTSGPRKAVLAEFRDSGHPSDPPISTSMVCDGRYKTIVWHSRDQGAEPTGELYDLEAGPDELLNLWHDPHLAQTRARLLLTMATELTLPSAGWPRREAPF